MKKAICLTALLVSVSFAAAAPSAAAGAKLFGTSCAGCHGAKAQGGVGPSLKDAAGWKYDLFKRALQQSKDDKGVALKATMMKFPKLKDDEMKSIQMFLKTATK